MTGTKCECPKCKTFLGWSRGDLVCVGTVKRCPDAPDNREYKPCRHCRHFAVFAEKQKVAA